MKKIATMAPQQRAELFTLTASKMGITPAAAEKDFWITWVLMVLFEHPELKRILCFKGGTSLSKCYQQIERFSEDIDLILDWTALTQVNPEQARSKTQQSKLNKEINSQAQTYIQQTLLPTLIQAMQGVCVAAIDKADPHNIHIQYPAAFKSDYLRPQVLLEIGPLAAMLPKEQRKVQSYAATHFTKVFEQASVWVPTIAAQRTFYEKLTILHAEAHRPEGKPFPSHYARHYYDVYRMIQTGLALQALQTPKLLSDVVAFKQKFYPMAWANYDSATLNKIQLIPSSQYLYALEKDYQSMQEMIFGESPNFEYMLKSLSEFQTHLQQLALPQSSITAEKPAY